MNSMSFGEWWLEYIEINIEKKYAIKDPIFLINHTECSRVILLQWFDNVLFEKRWIKYKHFSENVFQLKSFFPDPPADLCEKMINEELNELDQRIVEIDSLSQHKALFEFCGEVYGQQDLRRELLYSLLSGHSNVEFYLQKKEEKVIVKAYASSLIGSEMDIWIKDKYLSLEYNDN
jgi:hypothetical protein